jgi:uncharacterized protein
MKILIDIGHPAHVHLFKNFAHQMIRKGHLVHFTVRNKEFEIELLEHESFSYTILGSHFKNRIAKIYGFIKYNVQIFVICLRFKPDVFLSHGSIYTLLSVFCLRKTNISLEDTGNPEQVMIYLPFTKVVLTSTSFLTNYGRKQINYNGYHELAYLHPKYFNPELSILTELGLTENEKFFIIRFVSWDASHDIGRSGLTYENKKEIINKLSEYGRVFISSESFLPAELEKYKFPAPPERIHHALSFAQLFIGEGATMASESAMLGTTAVYINSNEAGSIDEQEKYHLIYHFRNSNGVIEKTTELLNDPLLKEKSREKSKKMILEKIDLTAYLVWFMENWPESFALLKENPDYQYRFQ